LKVLEGEADYNDANLDKYLIAVSSFSISKKREYPGMMA
jgi:hypothetical protein